MCTRHVQVGALLHVAGDSRRTRLAHLSLIGETGRRGYRLLLVHPIGGLLRLAGSREDGTGILRQNAQPRGKVRGMIGSRMVGNAEIGKHKPAEDLHTAFFRCIGGRAEPTREIAVKPVLCP